MKEETYPDIKSEELSEQEKAQEGENESISPILEVEAEATQTIETSELVDELAALKNELENAQKKSEQHLEGWQRERAEFSNYRKRIERERDAWQQNQSGMILKRYLEILDDLELALKNRPKSGEGYRWAAGIELVYRKLVSILEAEGVKPMDATGQVFDPNMHEAISLEDNTDGKSGHILEVVKVGYLQGERVLRPAKVKVAK